MMPDRVRLGARAILRGRITRLIGLLDDDAPDALVASATHLVGKMAWDIAPHAMAETLAIDAEYKARLAFGACTTPGCDDGASVGDEYCPVHAADYAGMLREAEAVEEKMESVTDMLRSHFRRDLRWWIAMPLVVAIVAVVAYLMRGDWS